LIIPEDLRNFADNVNRQICDRPVDDDDFPSSPFNGGQCEGVLYRAVGEARPLGVGCASGAPLQFAFTPVATDVGAGPISDLRVVNSTPFCQNRFRSTALVCTRGNGTTATIVSFGGPFNNFDGYDDIEFTIDFVRVDGAPDTCGDPPPTLPPPGPITINIDIDYGPNNEFNLTVPVIFAPVYVDLDGSLNFNFEIPEINLNGTVNLNNDFEINLDFSGSRGRGTTDDEPVPTPPAAEDSEDDEPSTKPTIVGVFVYTTALDRKLVTIIPQDGAPSIVAPRVASVKFLQVVGDFRGWTPDIPVKSVRSYVPCPIPTGAVDVKVTGDFGSQVEAIPHYSGQPQPAA
jgi:hypothetical protein